MRMVGSLVVSGLALFAASANTPSPFSSLRSEGVSRLTADTVAVRANNNVAGLEWLGDAVPSPATGVDLPFGGGLTFGGLGLPGYSGDDIEGLWSPGREDLGTSGETKPPDPDDPGGGT